MTHPLFAVAVAVAVVGVVADSIACVFVGLLYLLGEIDPDAGVHVVPVPFGMDLVGQFWEQSVPLTTVVAAGAMDGAVDVEVHSEE